MKNLLNCHCVGLHSFPISFKDGLYKRVFYADVNHQLYENEKVAIHSHHVDIKITVLMGNLTNAIYSIDNEGDDYKKFNWKSHILNGNGAFEFLGKERIRKNSSIIYSSKDSLYMNTEVLHTVQVEKEVRCAWLIEEFNASTITSNINYSKNDLTKWTNEGLYIECDNKIRDRYLGCNLQEIIDSLTNAKELL